MALTPKTPLRNLLDFFRSSALRPGPPVCLLLLLFLVAPVHGQDKVVGPLTGHGDLQLEEPFPDLRFTRPVDFQAPGDGSGRIFVVEQAGVIKVFENTSGTASTEVFLDIRSRVRDQGNEEGLLGLAFHPAFTTNGYFFVDYTASNPRRTVVARYNVDPNDPDRALPGSETVILRVAEPYSNHNGGKSYSAPMDICTWRWATEDQEATRKITARTPPPCWAPLPRSGKVHLAVYDLLGHEVAVLVDTVEPAGNHAVRFDGGNLPSGAYTYRLHTVNGVVGRTMMLVK